MLRLLLIRLFILSLMALAASCAVSPETQAKIDAYNSSIPSCSSNPDCDAKWQIARSWALEHADFPILTESDERIMASSTLLSMSGVGVVVTKQAIADNPDNYQLLVDIECFSAYGCPNSWDLKLEFNRTVASR